ncbi:hypothetical protein [Streptomyces sp. ISL-98]|uniref:hypothetical protein n=1 Tax=Streptomyces sp. ISL-98 TaxID=2819192 RepID=UPI002035987D|nr:hypothetical protein [Streptomyces sp. ISL-98]
MALWDTGGWHSDDCTPKAPRATAYEPRGLAVAADHPKGGTIHYRDRDGCHTLRMDGPVHGLAPGGHGGHILAAGERTESSGSGTCSTLARHMAAI